MWQKNKASSFHLYFWRSKQIFRTLSKFWSKPCAFMEKYLFENLTLFDLIFTRPSRKSCWMTSYGQMNITIDIYLQNGPVNMCRTACLWRLFWMTRPCPFLLNSTLMQYNSWIYASSLGEFELFAVQLSEPRDQNVKVLHFGLDLTLAWHVALISKC